MHTYPMTMTWADQKTPIRLDIVCLIFALLLHLPLFFKTYDFKGRYHDRKKLDRLVSVNLIDAEALIKKPVVAPVVPVKHEKSLFEKLKALVKKEPPPPPPVKPEAKVEPKKLDLAPKEIKLEPKLNVLAPDMAKLEGKKGFETKADPKLVEAQKMALNAPGMGAAPLTAQKVGVVAEGAKLKSGKNNFQVAKNEALSGIGGGAGPKIAGAAEPAIAIRTGNRATVEKFAQAPREMKDKGKLGGAGLPGTSELPELGLRDKIIARDAPINQIGNVGGSQSRFSGETGEGGAAASPKKDITKRFDENKLAGGPGIVKDETAAKAVAPIVAPIKPVKKKKEMFEIVGPLKDRAVEKKVVPDYPLWAQNQGIQATVVLEFTVDRKGIVKENVVVVRTSGYAKLDQVAIVALQQWKWVPLPEDVYRDEVGQITINFQLE